MMPTKEDVRRALEACAGYLEEKIRRFQERSVPRPVLAFLGYGRAGKDTAAEYLGQTTGRTYGGSTSNLFAPLVAAALGQDTETAFAERHSKREYWFRFGNLVREEDPTLLTKLLLSQADFVVGLRSLVEVEASRRDGLVDLAIWIENPRVPPDPTVEFSASDCDITIVNDRTIEAYRQKLDKLAKLLNLHGT